MATSYVKNCNICNLKKNMIVEDLKDSFREFVCSQCSTTGIAYLLEETKKHKELIEIGKNIKLPSLSSENTRKIIDFFSKNK